ncbi:TetR family transcriptional regulator [Nocardioides perillae]|uniref:AcrR family transcriptional regulator n=1 Tax=Nocardioides perillae TaxID=1119534 RepID=A0A7Y9UME9_9ACTN|nr:AcrR family transcriptional regulator [Nocardioides perillae]
MRAAVLKAAMTLAHARGVRGISMGLIANAAGISRAALYKYFPGVDDILVAAHAEHVASHLAALEAARSCASTPGDALAILLGSYGQICAHRGHQCRSTSTPSSTPGTARTSSICHPRPAHLRYH